MKILSTTAHTIIGVIVGIVLLIAPMLFGFADMGAPATVAMGVGLFILLSELTNTSPLSLIKLVPMRVHIAVDVMTGLFLLLSPWIFGFADLAINAWVPHVLVGLLAIGYALVTNTADERSSVSHA